ncbi:outer membrane lipoprotein-sorting protein [Photobacterium chitinilyticum]|uniref:Outer membrane lipoprotein-sorting protein n=1 Tax=Photobacterium chitinilyticum TaxID=2485123 RepID=A0A444JNQ3_9GAMM|nr:outer membrane lipoprotein-sorting protein [Photobacterium chitinilyticum]RWX54703.1 outer membrane lipoprotein-sorting protein [Photobacterium chitinilyticum]
MSNRLIFKRKRIQQLVFGILASILACNVNAQPEKTVEEILQRADQYRLDSDAAKVVSQVLLYENGELEKTRQYTVYTRPERESLVVSKSKVEAGQKMLMLGDNYWLLMPKSRRPIRITPMQKLLGEASVGDISTLTWSEDYQGQWVQAVELNLPETENVLVNQLELTAKTSGASYQRIELWLEKDSDFPIKARMYLRSGKLAKEAWFTKGVRDARTSVIEMTLLDRIQPSKKTVIKYQEVLPIELDAKYYNPAYLSRNNVSGL